MKYTVLLLSALFLAACANTAYWYDVPLNKHPGKAHTKDVYDYTCYVTSNPQEYEGRAYGSRKLACQKAQQACAEDDNKNCRIQTITKRLTRIR